MNINTSKTNISTPINENSNEDSSSMAKEIWETLQDTEKLKYKKNLLQTIIINYFNSEYLSSYCWKGWPECTDWSDLYILTKEGVIKVWAWEFNRDTFINWVYGTISKEYLEKYKFKDSPLPLYVVKQEDSYFANEEVKELREQNPTKYLEKYTVLSYNPRDKSIISNYGKWSKDKNEIHINNDSIIWVSDAILLFRNKFISNFDKEFLNKYMSYLKSLTLEELKQYAKNSWKITDKNESILRNIIYNKMWCSVVGAWIYADEAIKSRYDLIQSFDTDKWKFTSIPEFNNNNWI